MVSRPSASFPILAFQKTPWLRSGILRTSTPRVNSTGTNLLWLCTSFANKGRRTHRLCLPFYRRRWYRLACASSSKVSRAPRQHSTMPQTRATCPRAQQRTFSAWTSLRHLSRSKRSLHNLFSLLFSPRRQVLVFPGILSRAAHRQVQVVRGTCSPLSSSLVASQPCSSRSHLHRPSVPAWRSKTPVAQQHPAKALRVNP